MSRKCTHLNGDLSFGFTWSVPSGMFVYIILIVNYQGPGIRLPRVMGLGINKQSCGFVGPSHWAWSLEWGAGESPGHTAAILQADKHPVFLQTGHRDGAAWPEQLGGGWWQEAVWGPALFLDGHGDYQKHREAPFLSLWAIAQDSELPAHWPRRATGRAQLSFCAETGRRPAARTAWSESGPLHSHSPRRAQEWVQGRVPTPGVWVPSYGPCAAAQCRVALGGSPTSCPRVSSQSCPGAQERT